MVEQGNKPGTDELRDIIGSPKESSGEFNLTPRIDMAIPPLTAEEDQEIALKEAAEEVFTREIGKHPEVKTIREMMRFTKKTLGISAETLAKYYGVPTARVITIERRGHSQRQIKKFKARFEGMFTIASIQERSVDDVIERRTSMVMPNGKISEFSVGQISKAGKISIAVAIAEGTLRHVQEGI